MIKSQRVLRYQVNFKYLTQKNVGTGTTRAIRITGLPLRESHTVQRLRQELAEARAQVQELQDAQARSRLELDEARSQLQAMKDVEASRSSDLHALVIDKFKQLPSRPRARAETCRYTDLRTPSSLDPESWRPFAPRKLSLRSIHSAECNCFCKNCPVPGGTHFFL